MLEQLTAGPQSPGPSRDTVFARLVKRTARRLLRWAPDGALVVELPSGERYRYGKEKHAQIPILKIRSYRVLWRALRRGSIGFAESYMAGEIDCDDLTGLFRFFARNKWRFKKTGGSIFKTRTWDRIAHLWRGNSLTGSRRNIADHYDLGNEFFRLWLDEYMVYSSAFYTHPDQSLELAQQSKLDLILDLLNVKKDDRILEIGCGWGAFAARAAITSNARVTGITLSQEQLTAARNLTEGAGLKRKCTFELQDYRETKGKFDHIASIEMIEAVGETFWPDYFKSLRDRLKPGGRAVIQAITIDEGHFNDYRRKADFIQRYIFPGGMLPTASVMETLAREHGLVLDHVQHFGESYARTLREWRTRFEKAWPQIRQLGFDEHFRRRWRYYLCYCEAGFLEEMINVGAYRFTKT